MAKKKKTKKSKSSLDNLQFKPILIAFFAGMFLGIQASNTGAMAMFAFGAIAGAGLSIGAYYSWDSAKRRQKGSE